MSPTYIERVEEWTTRLERHRPIDIPTWLQDQADAASRESAAFAAEVNRVAVNGEGVFIARPPRQSSREDIARWMAAVERTARCCHLRSASTPLLTIVNLNLDRSDCRRCAGTFRRPRQSPTCEICGELSPDGIFREFVVQFGNVVIFGNAGQCCDDLASGHGGTCEH